MESRDEYLPELRSEPDNDDFRSSTQEMRDLFYEQMNSMS